MSSPEAFAPLQRLVDSHDRFLVISHVRPDGDAYGSTLGLGLALRGLGKEVKVVNADGMAPLFGFLPGSETIEPTTNLPRRPTGWSSPSIARTAAAWGPLSTSGAGRRT